MQTSIALGSSNFQVSLRLLRCASCGLLRVLPRSRLDPGVMSDPREACFEEKLEDTYFLRTVLGILICHIWEICIPTHEKSIFIWICFKPLLLLWLHSYSRHHNQRICLPLPFVPKKNSPKPAALGKTTHSPPSTWSPVVPPTCWDEGLLYAGGAAGIHDSFKSNDWFLRGTRFNTIGYVCICICISVYLYIYVFMLHRQLYVSGHGHLSGEMKHKNL